jgi:hypothetical protein
MIDIPGESRNGRNSVTIASWSCPVDSAEMRHTSAPSAFGIEYEPVGLSYQLSLAMRIRNLPSDTGRDAIGGRINAQSLLTYPVHLRINTERYENREHRAERCERTSGHRIAGGL